MPAAVARYRLRVADGGWTPITTVAALPAMGAPLVVELASSHDEGQHGSPSTRVRIAPGTGGRVAVSALERETR